MLEGSPDETRDNALGAVARILMAQGAHLPVDQVGTIFYKYFTD